MKLKKGHEPTVEQTPTVVVVTLRLEGDDPGGWQHAYNDKARESGSDARAGGVKPWFIRVPVGDGRDKDEVMRRLEVARGLIQDTNQLSYSPSTGVVEGWVKDWWHHVP